MNKIISINIKGQLFQIDEEAYQELNAYMERLKFHFRKEQGWQEIVDDFETRMFEMFRQEPGINGFITKTHVAQVIGVLGDPTQFDADATNDFAPIPVQNQRKRLYRNPDDRWLGGLCSGLGYYFNVETLWLRLLFLILFFGFGTGLLLYLILWILVPEAKTTQDKMEMRGESISIENIERNIREEFERIKKNFNAEDAKNVANRVGKTVGLKTESVARGMASVFSKLLGVFFILIGASMVIAFGVMLIVLSKTGLLFSEYPMLTALFDDASLALLFRICCVALVVAPAIALVVAGYRLLFSIAQKPWLGKLMGSIWLGSLVGVVVMIVYLLNNWQSKAEQKDEVVMLAGNSISIENLPTLERNELRYFWGIRPWANFEGGYALQSDSIYRPVRLIINQSNDSMARLKVFKSAFGKDETHANQNAQLIKADFVFENGKLMINPLMGISLAHTWRNQQLTYELELPIGFEVMLNDQLPSYFLQDLDPLHQHPSYKLPGAQLKMTADGLQIELTETQNEQPSDWDFSQFEELEINGASEIELIDGENDRILAQNEAAQNAQIKQIGNKLIIKTNENLHFKQNARFIISAKTWQRIETNGLHTFSYHIKNSPVLDLEHNGNTKLTGNVNVERLKVEMNGLTDGRLVGKCQTFHLSVSGMGEWNSAGLKQQNLELETTGNAVATVHAGTNLKVEANGNSKVFYVGSPQSKNVETSGLSSVTKKVQ